MTTPEHWVASPWQAVWWRAAHRRSRRKRRVTSRAVQSRTDGRCAHIGFEQLVPRMIEVTNPIANHHRVGAEFLAERHGYGVLIFRTANLDHVGELLGLRFQRHLQFAQAAQRIAQREPDAELDRRGIRVVGGL